MSLRAELQRSGVNFNAAWNAYIRTTSSNNQLTAFTQRGAAWVSITTEVACYYMLSLEYVALPREKELFFFFFLLNYIYLVQWLSPMSYTMEI